MSKAIERAIEVFPHKEGESEFMHSATEKLQQLFVIGYEQALKDLADEAIKTEDALILKGLIDAKSGELYNMKENKELLKDFCHKIGGSAVNVIIKKR